MRVPELIYNPPQIPLEILYQDQDMLILNKPAGLLTVPGKALEHKDCLESRVQAEFPRARIVHRLDMDTSGLIVMALNIESLRNLSRQFENKTTRKTYVCLVGGLVAEDSGSIDLPLRCDWPNRPLQIVDQSQGKKALTHWKVLERLEDQTRLELTPITGRSHQLRVHCLSMGHPIVGDRFYAPEELVTKANRLCLHAQKLGVQQPVSGEDIEIFCKADF